MELNQAIHEKLETFNHKPFQKREAAGHPALQRKGCFCCPLSGLTPFETGQSGKVATVQYNYHISVERMNYSVPYEYIKRQVDVRLTRATVEIFFSGTRIASHLRLHGRPNQCGLCAAGRHGSAHRPGTGCTARRRAGIPFSPTSFVVKRETRTHLRASTSGVNCIRL